MFDIYNIREDFPIIKNNKAIYLDNAATTYRPQSVIDGINEYLTHETANSHRGDYDSAYLVDKKISETRLLVKEFINAKSVDEIVFTSGTTMSLNLVAQSYGLKFLKEGDEIILNDAEHASNTIPWLEVSRKTGAIIKYVELDEKGRVTSENVRKVMSEKTKIVALAHISNVLGYINDVKAISKVVHEYNAVLVVDGAQSVPHLKTDVQDLGVDFLAFSAHKMLGPSGIGVLYGKSELLAKMDPFHLGGGMNVTFDHTNNAKYFDAPVKFEAGTLSLESIYGFHAALLYLNKIGVENITKHEHELRSYAINQLKKIKHITLYNEDADVGIITFNVNGVFAQDAATFYNSRGIALRSGQHCAKNLKNFLNTPATIRASLYLYTSKEEIDAFIEASKQAEDFLDAYF